MAEFIDETGKIYFRIAVLSYAKRNTYGAAVWNCVCSCGIKLKVRGSCLRSGNVKSCGCYQKEQQSKFATHDGRTANPLFKTWLNMIDRCENPQSKSYKDYGGRGISICPRWKDFWLFVADMNKKPTPAHTIDRIDNDGNYTPINCKWSTKREQRLNRRIAKRRAK